MKLKTFLLNHWPLIGIMLFGAFLGLSQLNNLPAEMWGDATAHYSLAQQVQHGRLFYDYRYGGDGPIYTYLVVALSWIRGLSFYTLKLTSVLVYLLFIFVMYLLANELFKKKEIAYLTSFITAVSFWSIVFARQPHARMLVPLFIAITTLFAVKKKTIFSGIFLGLGMYTQASFWAMPLLFWKRYKILLIGLLITLPLAVNFAIGKVGFFTNQSYFGEKLATSDQLSFITVIVNFLHNIGANFLSFFLFGDQGFRLNVPNSPHLDIISAIFFFIGFGLLIARVIKNKRQSYLEFIILPFFIIQIPSLLDIHNPFAQPNIGRMIGVTPFVYMATAYGIAKTWHFITEKDNKTPATQKKMYYSFLAFTLLIITALNLYKYFILYPFYLPDHNTPFAKIIAEKMDSYPSKTSFVVVGQGWGERYQPEQQAIIDSAIKPHDINFVDPSIPAIQLCQTLQMRTNFTVLITNPEDSSTQTKLTTCKKQTFSYILQKNGFNIAKVIEVK